LFGQERIGVYGKIPVHGDFLNQNLPRDFLDVWDHWLQQSILASQEVLGEEWLAHFLISPVWRFVLPSGCTNHQAWAGIMLPSVDRVGRYYPLTLVAPLPKQVGVFEYIANAEQWFQWLEGVAMMTLEKGLDVDALMQALNETDITMEFASELALPLAAKRHLQHVVPLDSFSLFSSELSSSGHTSSDQSSSEGVSAGDPLARVMPLLCDALLKPQASRFSLWWTKGGEHVEPALLLSDQLPRPTSYTALLNGQWHNWHWPNLLQPKGS